jgi:hypothetical protein
VRRASSMSSCSPGPRIPTRSTWPNQS